MDAKWRELARRHNIGEATVTLLADGLRRSGGRQVQFNHPDLGGMGQWMPGMVMVGDMFNNELKARVDALCCDVATLVAAEPTAAPFVAQQDSRTTTARWWPEELGAPSATGGQNRMRYAVFPDADRLVVAEGSTVAVYDTSGRRITGVSQQQSGAEPSTLVFSGPDGTHAMGTLKRVL